MPGPGEPLWTDEDAAKALAYLHHLRSICPDCGEYRGDWLDENGKELEDPPKELYDVVCPSCAWTEDEQAERRERSHPKHHLRGVKLGFRWVPEPPASGEE